MVDSEFISTDPLLPSLSARSAPSDSGPSLAEAIHDLTALAKEGADGPTLLHRLAESAVLVCSVEGAGTMIINGGSLDFVNADSPRTAKVDRLQDILQEGPCLSSVQTCEPIAVSDFADEQATTRWPALCTAALAVGLHSTLAMPLVGRGKAWGVLDLYRDRPYVWTPADLQIATTLAKITVTLLVLTAGSEHLGPLITTGPHPPSTARMVSGGAALARGLQFAELSTAGLWGQYLHLGGSHTRTELVAYLNGDVDWNAGQHDIAAHALHEYLTDHALHHHVAYSNDI